MSLKPGAFISCQTNTTIPISVSETHYCSQGASSSREKQAECMLKACEDTGRGHCVFERTHVVFTPAKQTLHNAYTIESKVYCLRGGQGAECMVRTG